MAHHVLRYPHIVVDLAVVHLENKAHEVGKDCCAACLGLDGWCLFACFCADDGETGCGQDESFLGRAVARMMLRLV